MSDNARTSRLAVLGKKLRRETGQSDSQRYQERIEGHLAYEGRFVKNDFRIGDLFADRCCYMGL